MLMWLSFIKHREHGVLSLQDFDFSKKHKISSTPDSTIFQVLHVSNSSFVMKRSQQDKKTDTSASKCHEREKRTYNALYNIGKQGKFELKYILCCYLAWESEGSNGHSFHFLTPKYGIDLDAFYQLNKGDFGLKRMTDACSILLQIATGLLQFHRLDYVLADLKMCNVLINDDLRIKLIDFETTMMFHKDQDYIKCRFEKETTSQLPPERLCEIGFNMASDCWQLSLISLNLMIGSENNPYTLSEDRETQQRAVKRYVTLFLSSLSSEYCI